VTYVRLKFLAAAILVTMVLVLVRMLYMQVALADYYRDQARRNQVKVKDLPAPRGTVLARDNTVLAEDRPVLSVCVVLSDLYKMSSPQLRSWYETTAAVTGDTTDGVAARVQAVWDAVQNEANHRAAVVLRRAPADVRTQKKAVREADATRRERYRNPQVIYDDVPFALAARAEVASADVDGLVVKASMKRKYPAIPVVGRVLAPQAVGYVGAATPEQAALYRFDYNGDERKRVAYDDVMGVSGVERFYNFELKGSRGRREEVVNVHKQTQKILSDEPAAPGTTLALGIDPPLQAAAEKALADILNSPDPNERHPGAAVCMDVRTGEVLVMASSPSYDPNTVSDEIAKLTDPRGLGRLHPFQNRAVSSPYPMGSVFKVITTTAALETHAISPSTEFTCNGVFYLGKNAFHCWISRPPYNGAHGSINLLKAIHVSCNIYFFNAGRAAGGHALNEWATRYGLGQKTGIDLPSEAAGNVPYPQYPGDVVNLSIGQGALMATPIQVCRMIAAVANGGKLLTPHLWREKSAAPVRGVGVSAGTLAVLRQGLYNVVNVLHGTGYTNARSSLITIAGKTGTAQAPAQGDQRGDHAWFAGYAPYDDPQIAFAVLIEHGGHGGAVAGPVAKAIAEAYAVEKGFAPAPGAPRERRRQ